MNLEVKSGIKFRYICYLLSAIGYLSTQAQTNLVPDPGFENLSGSKPLWNTGPGQFTNYMKDWFTPSLGTSDIFSTGLSPDYITALPASVYPPTDWLPRGNQLPRSGEHIVGIKVTPDNRREYVAVKLSCPLIPGEQYYAEVYVNLCEQTNIAQNNLGMYFSDTMVYADTYDYLDFTPQILETSIISDSINWTKISGTFTATSPAEYLLIGCFAKEADSDFLYLGNKGDINFAYYFLDDVSVTAVNPLIPVITITGDTTVCKNDTLTLKAFSSHGDVEWYTSSGIKITGDSVLKTIPLTSTYFEVRSKNCYAASSQTQPIVVFPTTHVSLGNDTSICNGTQIVLQASGLSNHIWQNTSVMPPVQVNSPTFIADVPGTYTLEALDTNGCKTTGAIHIDYYPTPTVDLGPDLLTCEISGTLLIEKQKGISYEWSDGSTDVQFSYKGEGTYWVTLSGICGTQASDSIRITEIHMFIQNLITANDDNKNDAFVISGIELGKGTLNIFNRYGAKIFGDEKYSCDWKAENISEGIYYYEFSYPGCTVRKGWVQVMH